MKHQTTSRPGRANMRIKQQQQEKFDFIANQIRHTRKMPGVKHGVDPMPKNWYRTNSKTTRIQGVKSVNNPDAGSSYACTQGNGQIRRRNLNAKDEHSLNHMFPHPDGKMRIVIWFMVPGGDSKTSENQCLSQFRRAVAIRRPRQKVQTFRSVTR